MSKSWLAGLLAGAVLAGCGVAPTAAPPGAVRADVNRYRCEQDIEFTVRFANDSALVDAGPRGREKLLRDAGGVTPQQSVYSNPNLRAEFGLGAGGRGAILHFLAPQVMAQCLRD